MKEQTITIPSIVCVGLKRFLKEKESYNELIIRLLTQLSTNPQLHGKDPISQAIEYSKLLTEIKQRNSKLREIESDAFETLTELKAIQKFIKKVETNESI
jgi:predicted CopG family antitoxin